MGSFLRGFKGFLLLLLLPLGTTILEPVLERISERERARDTGTSGH